MYDLSSHCGYVSRSGKECAYWAVEGSPVNLCMEHLRQAAKFYEENISELAKQIPDPSYICPDCEKRSITHAEGNTEAKSCALCGRSGGSADFTAARPPTKRDAYSRVDTHESESVVYYIQHGNRVKIGTSTTWRHRLAVLPHDRLLALEPGDRGTEQHRHTQFSTHRVGRTEWFAESNELWDHITQVNGDQPQYDAVIKTHNRHKRLAG